MYFIPVRTVNPPQLEQHFKKNNYAIYKNKHIFDVSINSQTENTHSVKMILFFLLSLMNLLSFGF